MNAPDKIYVFQHGFNAFDPLWHFTESKEKHTESHEYIRKDALLEWAMAHKSAIEINGEEDDAYTRGEYSVILALIDKLKLL